MGVQQQVVIGMDPHKRSVTVEVMEADETIVGHGRFGTDVAGFAQLVGFVFAVVGTAGFAFGITALGLTATAFALVAAFLNAAFGICLGCQIYPLVARLRRAPNPA